MGKKIPSSCAIAIIVEPGTEDEVGCDAEEYAVDESVSSISDQVDAKLT